MTGFWLFMITMAILVAGPSMNSVAYQLGRIADALEKRR